MGLQNTIQTKLKKAFDTSLSDALTSFTLARGEESHYNPNSGVIDSAKLKSGPGRGVFDQFTRTELDDNSSIVPSDVKIIALLNELPFDPIVDDVIVTATSTPASPCRTYKVVGFNVDPTYTVFEIQCRRASNF